MKKTALLLSAIVLLLSACGGEDDTGQTCATPVATCTLGGNQHVGASCVCQKDGQLSEGKVVR